jgi:hypothetical protein
MRRNIDPDGHMSDRQRGKRQHVCGGHPLFRMSVKAIAIAFSCLKPGDYLQRG